MNFKSLREDKLKLSYEDMAKMLGVDIAQIKAWDDNNSPSLQVIQKIAEKTGMDFNTILSYEKPKPKPFDAKNTWEKANFTKKSITEYISNVLTSMDVTEEQRVKYIDELSLGIEANLIKPSISIVGRSDTGKSTLINALIGMEKMPTSWTPTTSIAVYIKHIKDRPDFIKDDAWVFVDHVGEDNLWNAKRLYDKEYCEKWKIAQGGVEILRSFGTRQGDNFKKNAGSAVVFLDAPILLDCDIVDLPGFGTEKESDDIITFKAAQRTDILIYLSQANGFMRIEDITYLKENIRNLPVWENKALNNLKPLSNLFVVASQAHTVGNGNPLELSNILKKGYENFSKTLSSNYWKKREKTSGYRRYGESVLPTRFFTYTTDILILCKTFNDELKMILEALPDIINERTKDFIREYVKTRKPNLEAELKKYEQLVDEREKYVGLLHEIEGSELKRTQENDMKKKEIRELINQLTSDSKKEFNSYYLATINTDAIAAMMKKKGIKNKKDDVECFASQLQDEIQAKCDSILQQKSDVLSVATKQYVEKYSKGIEVAFAKLDIDVDFDARFAFASSLAKIGIIGGLDAYIASEAAFMLASMPFIMGIGGNIALGAGIFGPIGIVVGLAIAGVLGLVKLFGGGWEKRVAKKLAKSYNGNNVVKLFCDSMEQYWCQTKDAFNKATKELDIEWNNYVETLRNTVNNYDINEINDNIVVLKNIMSFFDNIPL